MRVFAIADLHLPGGQDKTMEMFGSLWQDHWQSICYHWLADVTDEDIVLLPGDISWAMTMDQVKDDLAQVLSLPGKKVLLRGNHDFWWSAIGRVRAALQPDGFAIQNDSLRLGDVVICGSRGWLCPGRADFTSDDEAIYAREALRLRMSLEHAARWGEDVPKICMMHYPPFNEKLEDSHFTNLFNEFGIKTVVYGHLHGAKPGQAFEGALRGVEYHLVSCDHLNFRLKPILI